VEEFLQSKNRMTLTEQVRHMLKGVIDPIAEFLNRIGLAPNTITILGLIGNVIGAALLINGKMTLGGIVILVTAPLDALDGTMARLRGENRTDSSSTFGAFLDSVIDRYAELAIYGGLLIYFALHDVWIGVILAYLAATGSILVSYTRARAQALGIETKIGILTRLERYLVLVPALLFNIPLIGLWILAIFSNLTALQRILDVYRKMNSQKIR
jgi:CDP-diacylglycerol--glycerol-3-phosphate 3-phosphatidyltransferase